MHEQKPLLKDALRKLRTDHARIKRELGITEVNLLDEKQLRGIAERINDLTPKPKWDGGSYTPYCLGLMFIQDHIMNKLRDKNKLTGEEERLLRRARGRVHYNPPKREYASRAKACSVLAMMG